MEKEENNFARRGLKILRLLGMLLCLAGCLWFLLPFLRGGFRLGAAFGFCVCLLGFLLLKTYGRAARKGGWAQAFARLLAVFYTAGLLWAAYLTGLMLSARLQSPPAQTNLIVLGAQVYSAERMGVALTGRVQRAAEYLEENPEAVCILTGGQGDDEPCPESLTARNALLRLGVAEDRLFLEEKSRNTRQNLIFAKELAEEQGLGSEFALITQGFHMFRALKLAEEAGVRAYGVAAATDPLLLPEYYGRELLSLTKWHGEKLILQNQEG